MLCGQWKCVPYSLLNSFAFHWCSLHKCRRLIVLKIRYFEAKMTTSATSTSRAHPYSWKLASLPIYICTRVVGHLFADAPPWWAEKRQGNLNEFPPIKLAQSITVALFARSALVVRSNQEGSKEVSCVRHKTTRPEVRVILHRMNKKNKQLQFSCWRERERHIPACAMTIKSGENTRKTIRIEVKCRGRLIKPHIDGYLMIPHLRV
jgi:hypothetical protein